MPRYNAKKVREDGYVFDSKGEHQRYLELKLLQRAGKIRNLKVHPKYPLHANGKDLLVRSKGFPNGRRSHYTADFEYLDLETGELVTEDYKGSYFQRNTDAAKYARLKMGVFELCYGRRVRVVG